jgi:hypothetical protein
MAWRPSRNASWTRVPENTMRQYDRAQPLIFVHVPKAAGQSTREHFRAWFPGRLYENYFDEQSGTLPVKHDLVALRDPERPLAIYGHFNRLRHFGVEHYYPEVSQFVTILREPFELAVSNYFFIRKTGMSWKDQTRMPKADLRQFLRDTPANMLNHFPRVVTKDNYRDLIEEFFIEIGVMEDLDMSLARIAAKLSQVFERGSTPHLNATPRAPYPADLRDEYAARNPLEFEVYRYVLSRVARREEHVPTAVPVPAAGY